MFERNAVQLTGQFHSPGPKKRSDLDHGLDVVGAVEEGKTAGEDGEQNDASGPNVKLGGLLGALEEDLGGAEAASACTVGTTRRSCVIFGVAMVRTAVGEHGALEAGATSGGVVMADAWLGVGAFALGEAKVNKHAAAGLGVVEKVGGLDVTVDDACLVGGFQSGEKAAHVDGHVLGSHGAEVVAKVVVAEVREDGDDLIGAAKSGDQRADSGTVFQVVEEFELVENALGRRSHVDLLDGDVSGAS